jgi:XTP/dITP diphosphohydrolase
MKTIWVATMNQGKLNEFRNILSQYADVHSSADLKVYSLPKETGQTFEENARIKARSLKSMKPGEWIVADDSGIEVEGLGGMPGIHSARYAGEKAGDSENTAKLLKMVQIRTNTNRKAQFRCVLVAYSPTGEEFVLEGTISGMIASSAKGTTGFGYDSVFIPDGQAKTYAELGHAFKNQGSHRAQAIRKLIPLLSAAAPSAQP